jgi:uncharacterized OsmC-like protein
MEVTIRQIDKVKFAVQARSHTIICDQPIENGGEDAGMTPPELLLASLGACVEFYAVEYLRARQLAESGVEVTVTAEKLKLPTRLGNFHVRVNSPVALTEDQNVGLMRAVHHCLIHNTLMALPQIQIELTEVAVAHH